MSWDNFLQSQFAAAGRYTGIDPWLLRAMAMYESRLVPNITTTYIHPKTGEPVHHYGLMQLSAENAKKYGVTDPLDPGQNVMGGALLLRDNLNMYDGDLSKALQQYNGGNPSRWGPATRLYVQTVRKNFHELTGQQPPDILPQIIQPPPPPMLRPGSTETPPPFHPSMNTGPSAGLNLAQYQAVPSAAAQMWPGGPAAGQPNSQPPFALGSRGPLPLPQPTSQSPSLSIQALLTNAVFGGPTGARIGSMPGLDPTSQLLMGSGFNSSSPLSLNSAGPGVWPWGRRGS
jgi:hypothetical protein